MEVDSKLSRARGRFLCDDFEEAKRNRERVAEFLNQDYYAQQAHAIVQWQWGQPAPKDLALGELPFINRPRPDRNED